MKVLTLVKSALPPPLGVNRLLELFVLTGHFVSVPVWKEASSTTKLPSIIGTKIDAPRQTGEIDFYVEELFVSQAKRAVRLSGWACPAGGPLFRRHVSVVLISNDRAFEWPLLSISRPDLQAHFGKRWMRNCGFRGQIDISGLPAGQYRVGLRLERVRSPLEGAIGALKDFGPGEKTRAAPAARELHSLAELDEEMEWMAEALTQSFEKWAIMRDGFRYYENVAKLPSDPFSDAYKKAQIDLYRSISGVDDYNPWKSEPIPVAFEGALDPYPYPFSSKDAGHIGNYYISAGHILRTIKNCGAKGRALLHNGCGVGFTTLALAASGYDVTAVDINADCLKVVDALAAARKLTIKTFNGEFGQVPEPGKIFDVILFYASFHHCIDFQELLRTLRPMLADDGALILACEAVFADFPKPWGLRLARIMREA